jgi:hypothetical protein
MRTLFLIAAALCCCYLHTFAQDGSAATAAAAENKGIASISDRSLAFIHSKYSKLTNSLERQSSKMLQRMQRKEQS